MRRKTRTDTETDVGVDVYLYEVRDLFPSEMLTKIVISYMLDYFIFCEKIQKLATNELKLGFKLLLQIFLDASISTGKSTNEIDAGVTQNEMSLYLIPPRQLKLSFANEYTPNGWYCQMTHGLHIDIYKIHSQFFGIVILSNCYETHDEKCSFLLFGTTRVKRSI